MTAMKARKAALRGSAGMGLLTAVSNSPSRWWQRGGALAEQLRSRHLLNPIDGIYAKIRRIRGLLGNRPEDNFATTEFTEEERNQSDLHRLFYSNEGPIVHKWKHYLSIYDKYLAPFRKKPVRVLEIGVFKGGSMYLWRQYFGPEAIIFGIDIDPKCAAFDGRNAQVRIGSQDDLGFLDQVLSEMGALDVVIDDGSHVSPHQVASFNFLFPRLNRGGVYICEDVHSNYWRGWHQGGYRRSSTFIETCKRLVDDIHSDFHSHRSSPISAEIAAIHFYNSMVVIEKGIREVPSHIKIGK
jgi:cephalosporin hydroxylase